MTESGGQACEKWGRRGLAAGTVLLLLLFAALFCLARPLGDDIEYMRYAGGWAAYVRTNYIHWTGRWAGFGLTTFLLSYVYPIIGYGGLLLAANGLQFFGLLAFWRLLLGADAPRRTLAAVSLAFVWAASPGVKEAVFWLTGVDEYPLPFMFSLMVIAFAAMPAASGKGTPIRLLLAGVAGFCVACMHEVNAVAMILVLTVCAAAAWRTPGARRLPWLLLLGVYLLGFLFVFCSPGHGHRMTEFGARHQVLVSLKWTAKQCFMLLPGWILDWKLACASAVLLLSESFRRARPSWCAAGGWRWGVLIPVLGLTVVAVIALGTAWGTGSHMPERLLYLVHLYFLAAWFAWLTAVSRGVPAWWSAPGVPIRFWRGAALAALGASLALTGNGALALRDLTGRAPAWRRAMLARDETIRQAAARGERTLAVEPIVRWPHLYPPMELAVDPAGPDGWINTHVANYYGLASVRLTHTAPRDSE